jgi:hypothetical protein
MTFLIMTFLIMTLLIMTLLIMTINNDFTYNFNKCDFTFMVF